MTSAKSLARLWAVLVGFIALSSLSLFFVTLQANERPGTDGELREAKYEHEMGETVALSFQHDETDFRAVSWDGEIDLTITNASILSSQAAVDRFADDERHYQTGLADLLSDEGEWLALLIELRIDNIDASVSRADTEKGRHLFNITEFLLRPENSGSVLYFNEAEGAGEDIEGNNFLLAPGTSKKYTVVYAFNAKLLHEKYWLSVGATREPFYGVHALSIDVKQENKEGD